MNACKWLLFVVLDIPCSIICSQVWDVGGSVSAHSLLPTYLQGAHAVLALYDQNDAQVRQSEGAHEGIRTWGEKCQ